MADYLTGDLYVEDEETVTRIFLNNAGRRSGFELTPVQAQLLFEQLAKRRTIELNMMRVVVPSKVTS